MPEDQRDLIIRMQNDMDWVKRAITEIKLMLDHNYVTQSQFQPVKMIVYGLVTLILTAVVGALIALVVIE